jgi:predicted nucleic acid-binding protein
MATNPVLVDSSYYIRLLRQGQDPLKTLALTAATRDLAVCGPIRTEVGRALRQGSVRDRFHRFWDVMLQVPTDNAIWAETEQTLWALDRQGIVLPLTDALIACCARRIDATVLAFDTHFQQIPGLKVTASLEQ